MKIHQIRVQQFFHLMILFQLGTIGLNLGAGAGKDSWISLSIGMLEGTLLFCMYYRIYKIYAPLSYVEILQNALGYWLGTFISLLYGLYFAYIGARITRDLSEILTLHILYETPIWIIIFLFVLTTSYVLYKGLNTVARVGTICIYMFGSFFVLFVGLVVISGIFHIDNIQPVLQYGWSPILQNILPVMIPYGEMISFLLLMRFCSEQPKIFSAGIYSILISGSILTTTTFLNIGILGYLISNSFGFPLLISADLIRVGSFIQRLEPLAILLFMIGIFFKVSVLQASSVFSFSLLIHKKHFYKCIFIIGCLMLFLAIIMTKNNINHIYTGFHIVPYYLHLPFQIIIPLILLGRSFFYKPTPPK
ncbi:endospore germination permease [Bacillus thuringiensis]|nr:endospore germination permease [Bacillus thuringiensis]